VRQGSFESLGLREEVLRAVRERGYRLPTPIQRRAVPLALGGADVVAMARTGSGKTAAFLLPVLNRLRAHGDRVGARAVVLSPTRELALQTFRFAKELGRFTGLRHALLVGGDSMEAQFEALATNPDVLIATPGRLLHHLSEVDGLSLQSVEILVFDEADRLFELGFAEQLRRILHGCPETRQTMLFSATMPTAVAEFAKAGLKEPQLVRLDAETKISPDLTLQYYTVAKEDKTAALVHLLRRILPEKQQTIVFASTKHHVEFLEGILRKEAVPCAAVYGAMDQVARQINVGMFRNGKAQVLLVTDVAARGLDIPLLDNVINFDFPAKPKLFVHRAGRAARNGRLGSAFSFLSREELPFLLDLHLFLGRPIAPAPPVLPTGEGLERGGAWEDVYGAYPQALLDTEVERLREWVAESADLTNLVKTSSRAYGLYLKTRPGASVESCARVKALAREGVHPRLAAAEVGGMQERADLMAFTQRLKSFRPAQTILEAEIAAARRGGGAGHGAMSYALEGSKAKTLSKVMQKKRQAHDRIIQASAKRLKDDIAAQKARGEVGDLQQRGTEEGGPEGQEGADAEEEKAAEEGQKGEVGEEQEQERGAGREKRRSAASARSGNSNQFRDEAFYVPSVPSARHADQGYSLGGTVGRSQAFDDMVLDLVPDDDDGDRRKRANFHWDKKKKKYIKLQPGEELRADGKRNLRNESGARVGSGDTKSGNLYRKWKEQSHRAVQAVGEVEKKGTPAFPSVRPGGKNWKYSVANAEVKDELKTPDQVRKRRNIKERNKLRQQGKAGRGRGAAGEAGGDGERCHRLG
jgi:ATP-dependent RNA helicase DDX54/DBP10